MALRFKPTFVPAFTDSASLKAIPTAGAKLNRVTLGLIGGGLFAVQLQAGNDADAPENGVWRPNDYNDATNARVQKATVGAAAGIPLDAAYAAGLIEI